ncbi:MAG: hypothetical protein ACT4OP_09295 [Actinomycetota bacterium]
MGKNFRSIGRWLGLASAAVLFLVTVPAAGTHIPTDAGTLRLHLGSDGTYFRYTDAASIVIDQAIGAPDRCLITVTGPLAAISGSDRGPGLVGNGIGVKTGGSQGTPCSQVDTTEDLTVTLVGVPNASRVDLDLELKSNAKVRIEVRSGSTLVGSYEVRSGSSIVSGQGVDGAATEPFTATATNDDPGTTVDESIANCKNQSDSGPDAGGRDNCKLTVNPDFPFDSIKFVPVVGAFSLEGSGDFADNTANDTIFYLTSFDGVIGCTSANNSVTDTDGNAVGTIVRRNNLDGSLCVLKPYSLTANDGDDSVQFDVVDPVVPPQPAAYEFFVTFSQVMTNPLTATLQYDPSAPYTLFVSMPVCTGDPFASPPTPGSIDPSVIPTGDTACLIEVHQHRSGLTTWHGIFLQDITIRGR